MSRVLLVNPPVQASHMYGPMRAVAGGIVPPLGLCHIASEARKSGHNVAILDTAALNLELKEAAQRIKNFKPDIIGFTATTNAVSSAAKIAQTASELFPDAFYVLGGPHISAVPIATMEKYAIFNAGVIGEGEETFVSLLKALESGDDLQQVSGLVLRTSGGIKLTQTRPLIRNLDSLAMPAWDLLEGFPKIYRPAAMDHLREPATILLTSRGCPRHCIFCDRSVFGGQYRFFSSDYILKMVEHLHARYHICDIDFTDDNFLVDRERFNELTDKLFASKISLSWGCSARVDDVDQEIIQKAHSAGCWQIGYGIESGSNKILKKLGKNITTEQIKNALKMTADAGIQTKGFFMLGNPGETEEDLRQTMDLTLTSKLHHFLPLFFTPLPGSAYFPRATQEGEFIADWDKMILSEPVFIPHGMTRENLLSAEKTMVKKFYSSPRVVLHHLGMLRHRGYARMLLRGFLAMRGYA